MKFTETPIGSAFIIDLDPIADRRGFFARTFCEDEFRAHGLNSRIVQNGISYNARRGTLRGLHYQATPHEEAKVVRCTAGAIFDVAADLRPSSPTRGRWFSLELSALNRRMLYVPEGVAHGFQTLTDNAEVLYQMSEFYHPESARIVAWTSFPISWPVAEPIMSDADRNAPAAANTDEEMK
jgi:dTDP-4-dehydrorhamnose 3,5-epimerase